MRKLYTCVLFVPVVLLSACSKDIFKKYDKRIIGTWRITDVDRNGFGGNTDNQTFTNGLFTFHQDGSLDCTDEAGIVYRGNWDIVKKQAEDESVNTLQIALVNLTNQQVRSQYYDQIVFRGTDHFKTTHMVRNTSFVTHFRR